jgi:hypothetical protein
MRPEALVERLKAQPFRPFTLVTADGAKFRVDHPEWVATTGRTAVVLDADENMNILDVALITRAEVEKPAQPQAKAKKKGGE